MFSTGATGDNERHFAQDKESHLGKILFKPFDSISNSYEIISSGHRNPQGLYSDSDVILSTEHGPYGGDEINKIEKGKIMDGQYHRMAKNMSFKKKRT